MNTVLNPFLFNAWCLLDVHFYVINIFLCSLIMLSVWQFFLCSASCYLSIVLTQVGTRTKRLSFKVNLSLSTRLLSILAKVLTVARILYQNQLFYRKYIFNKSESIKVPFQDFVFCFYNNWWLFPFSCLCKLLYLMDIQFNPRWETVRCS